MAGGFHEQGTRELLLPYVKDGEKLTTFASAIRWPSWFWYFVGPIGTAFMTKYYAVGAKESGLILVQLNWGGKEKQATVLRWRDIKDISFKKGIFRHRLSFTAVGGERFALSFQFLALFRSNRANAVELAAYIEKRSQGLERWAQ